MLAASYFTHKDQKNRCTPTFCLYNLTMLGKVSLRRNDFLFFQTERDLNEQMRSLQLDYLPVFRVFIVNGSASHYVAYW